MHWRRCKVLLGAGYMFGYSALWWIDSFIYFYYFPLELMDPLAVCSRYIDSLSRAVMDVKYHWRERAAPTHVVYDSLYWSFSMHWCKSKLRKCRLIRLRYQMLTSYYTFANWPIGKLQVIPVKICPSHFCKDPPIFHFWESSVSMASRETVTVSSTGPIVQRYVYIHINWKIKSFLYLCLYSVVAVR